MSDENKSIYFVSYMSNGNIYGSCVVLGLNMIDTQNYAKWLIAVRTIISKEINRRPDEIVLINYSLINSPANEEADEECAECGAGDHPTSKCPHRHESTRVWKTSYKINDVMQWSFDRNHTLQMTLVDEAEKELREMYSAFDELCREDYEFGIDIKVENDYFVISFELEDENG